MVDGTRSFFSEWIHGVERKNLAQEFGWRWSESPGSKPRVHGQQEFKGENLEALVRKRAGVLAGMEDEVKAHIYILTDL